MIKKVLDLFTYKPEPAKSDAPLQPPKVPLMNLPKRNMIFQDALERYGAIQGGRWARESEFMVNLGLKDMGLTWRNAATGLVCDHIYMNRDMTKAFLQAISNLKGAGILDELQTFDGCFNIRDVRGIPGQPSCHSYGLAIDINAKSNALGKPPTFSPLLVRCFKDAGFDWGGDFKRKDGMHFSYAWEHQHEIILNQLT